jgi:XrtJ-associated TM-motif-TM protein
MKKNLILQLCVMAVLLGACGTLHAIGGCDDSPEAPTDVLLMIGAAGMVYGSSLVTKLLRRKRNR